MNAITHDYEIKLSDAEVHYYDTMKQFPENEFGCVGTGLGGGFQDTHELHVMKYNEAMKTQDAPGWVTAVDQEHKRMTDHTVFKAVEKDQLPKDAKVISSTWAMKKKANGTLRARINALGYQQVDGEHYDEDEAAPVVNGATRLVPIDKFVIIDRL